MRSRFVLGAVALLLLAGGILLALRPPAGDSGEEAPIAVSGAFRDVAARRGLQTRQPGLVPCGYNSAGAAWGDVNGDGKVDLFLPRQQGGSELWLQSGDGSFRERGRAAGVAGSGIATTAAFGDHDDDGDLDLYVGAAGPDLLLDNDGSGSFQPLPFTLEAGVGGLGGDPTPTTAVSWIDFDRDGRLDVFATHGGNCKDDPDPAPNRLYRNLGGGQFAAADDLLAGTPNDGVTLDAVWFDAGGDGGPDLYVGNDDLNDRPNALLQPGPERFDDITKGSGAGISRFTMAVDAGDVDANGLADLAITDIGREALLLQTAPGRFSEQAAERGFGREDAAPGTESITWGVALADYDNDGDLDAYSAGGALGLDRDRHDDALYINDGSGGFEQQRVEAPGSGRTVAAADWDRDGDVDLLVAQLEGAPLLLENRAPAENRWIELRLIGRSPRQACGAVVRLRTAAGEQQREVDCRAGEQTIHFGLGAAGRARDVRVDWPSGETQTVGSLEADRLHPVREPRG